MNGRPTPEFPDPVAAVPVPGQTEHHGDGGTPSTERFVVQMYISYAVDRQTMLWMKRKDVSLAIWTASLCHDCNIWRGNLVEWYFEYRNNLNITSPHAYQTTKSSCWVNTKVFWWQLSFSFPWQHVCSITITEKTVGRMTMCCLLFFFKCIYILAW